MSKHGFYNSDGSWFEEPCNEHCRGSHHAVVVYSEDDEADYVPGTFMEANPQLVLLAVRAAPDALPLPDERNAGRIFSPLAVRIVYAEGRKP